MATGDYNYTSIGSVLAGHKFEPEVRHILNHEPIKTLLDSGCYLAGGFVRSVLLNQSPNNYLSNLSTGGDIDIFFDDVTRREEYRFVFKGTEAHNSPWLGRSVGGNAEQRYINTTTSSIRVQLVDHSSLILPIEQQLDRFDFTNCAVAMTRDKVIIHKRFYEIEAQKLLDVKHSESPFTGSRIYRYMSRRGLAGLTQASQAVVTDWIMKAVCGAFKTDTAAVVNQEALELAVRNILSSDLTSRPDDLLLVLGKFKHDVASYGMSHEVDFALHHLKSRVKTDEHEIIF